MIQDNQPLPAVNQPCDAAVDWVIEKLNREGLSIIRTFDLKVARVVQLASPCPHHGSEPCDCQMVVLLVYAEKHTPVTLIAYGYDEQTWFSVVNTPHQKADPGIESSIRQSFITPVIAQNY